MVTFETKCYENDWNYILKGDYLSKMIDRCNYDFASKKLFINNVKDIAVVKKAADKKIAENIIDEYVIVADHAAEALDFFNITEDSFDGGYYYSISELVSIYLCKTGYLLHFSGDSIAAKSTINWVTKAIEVFKSNPAVIVANPAWNKNYKQAKEESFSEMNDWYIGYGFSDQCYLVRTDAFKKPVYNFHHPKSKRYPKYGGMLFERRVDSYMRTHQLLRITSKETYYTHMNIPKSYAGRFLRNIKIG